MIPVPASLLRRFDTPTPRYTSYPTADRFVEAFGAPQLAQALRQRRAAAPAPLAVYVHIPFCESLCYYCACNKIITRRHDRGASYLNLLARELALYEPHLAGRRAAQQLHLGGGTPTFLNDEELSVLMAMLREHFDFVPDGEASIEVDPRTVDASRLAHLAALGFNRISFGVQDFDLEVQRAVHRLQPVEAVFGLMAAARGIGFASINIDLIYGLPRQTLSSFDRTLTQVIALRPDRIALYGYAHLPARFKSQRRIEASELPQAGTRLGLLSQSATRFAQAGYEHLGMDHFALPSDALAIARRTGRLHRDFQGYSTQPDGDVIGLGVSAIGRVGACYSQNAKTLEDYEDSLNQGRLPVARGLALSRDDLLRRAVIMTLMCQGRLLFEAVEIAWLIDFRRYFADELARMRDYEALGLVRIETPGLEVTTRGWYVIRAIALVFDRYLQNDHGREQYSRVL